MVTPLVNTLAALGPDIIIHSDMKRTRAIATPLAAKLGIAPIAEPLWRERDFGNWEGRRWNAIYRETGNAMEGMIDDPEHFRPGGGETTAGLVRRIKRALQALPDARSAVVISHGGPIACLQLILKGLAVAQLAKMIPKTGEITSLNVGREEKVEWKQSDMASEPIKL